MWQPIETAPDNTAVLVFGQWAGEINGIANGSDVYIAFKGSGRTDYAGFTWNVVGTDAYAAWVKPTHWMPLPDPPKGDDT